MIRGLVNHVAAVNLLYVKLLDGDQVLPLLGMLHADVLVGDLLGAYRATAAQVREAFSPH